MRKLTLVLTLTLTLTLVALAPLAHAGCPAANAHTSREARHLLRAASADAAELAAGTYSPRTLAARAARAARAYVVEARGRR